MPRLRSCVSVLLCVLLPSLGAGAEPPQPSQPNAALLYWIAFAARPSNEAQDKILSDWNTVPFDAPTMQVLESGANSLRYLHRGAAVQHCDWGLPLDEGLNLLLPHLVRARDLGRLAVLRARYDLEIAKSASAVDTIADTFALARHAGSDSLLISILVQCNIESMALDVAADHLLALDAPVRHRLAARLRILPAGGRLQDCMPSETQLIRDLTKALKEADLSSDWIHTIFIKPNVMPAEQARALAAAVGGTPQSFLKYLNDLQPCYGELSQILALPPDRFPARFDALQKKYDANPIAKQFLPSFAKAYERTARASARLAMLQAAIAVSLDGPDKLKAYPDPAGGGPFKYRPLPKGFELESAVVYENQPVVLVVR